MSVRTHDQRGSTLPFMALAILLTGVTVVLLGRVGGAATSRAGARNAADAAALAGAAAGRGAADDLARANGAELISYRETGNDTEVPRPPGPGRGDRPSPAHRRP